MEKRRVLLVASLFALVYGVSAQDKGLIGEWYRFTGDGVVMRAFYENGKGIRSLYSFYSSSSNMRTEVFKTGKQFDYKIKDLGIIQLGTEDFEYRISSQMFLIFENNWGLYRPLPPQDITLLQGKWKSPGETVDLEITVDDKKIVVIKGKQRMEFTYETRGFPDIVLIDEGKARHPQTYFLFEKDVLLLSLHGEGRVFLQRVE